MSGVWWRNLHLQQEGTLWDPCLLHNHRWTGTGHYYATICISWQQHLLCQLSLGAHTSCGAPTHCRVTSKAALPGNFVEQSISCVNGRPGGSWVCPFFHACRFWPTHETTWCMRLPCKSPSWGRMWALTKSKCNLPVHDICTTAICEHERQHGTTQTYSVPCSLIAANFSFRVTTPQYQHTPPWAQPWLCWWVTLWSHALYPMRAYWQVQWEASTQHDTPGDPQPASGSGHKMAVPPAIVQEIMQIRVLSTECTALTLLELADPGALSLGPPQSCLQLRYFGVCKSNTCTYKHAKVPAPTVQETKAVASLK